MSATNRPRPSAKLDATQRKRLRGAAESDTLRPRVAAFAQRVNAELAKQREHTATVEQWLADSRALEAELAEQAAFLDSLLAEVRA